MNQTTRQLYTSSMSVFYTIAKWSVNLYSNYADSFILFSETYSKEWADDMLKTIAEAQAMPNVAQRRGNTKAVGNGLDASSTTALLVWKKLKRYIIKSFAPDALEAALQQAGSTHYAKAAQSNFGEISALLTAGQTFIQQNMNILIQGGMPASLPDEFIAAINDFNTQHTAYGNAKSDATTGTSNKIAVNNQLYTQIMHMFGDAQIIFAGQKNVAAQFSFEAVKRIVTKAGASGIHFMVKDGNTSKPLLTASIITSNSPVAYTVDQRGSLFLKLSKGIYNFMVTAPGFAPFTGDIEIDSTGMSRLPVDLRKEAVITAAS